MHGPTHGRMRRRQCHGDRRLRGSNRGHDGGHFENLGLYELIARRCEYIIVVDGSADGEFTFSDLAKVTEMVRVDFGAQINLQVDSIRPDPASGRSKIAYALGTVSYPPLEGEGEDTEARILDIKSTVTDSSPASISESSFVGLRMPWLTARRSARLMKSC